MTWCIASTAGNSIDPRAIKQGSVGADHQYLVYRFGYRYRVLPPQAVFDA